MRLVKQALISAVQFQGLESALEGPNAISTPPKSPFGVKRSFEDTSDHEPNDECGGDNQLRPRDDLMKDNKRLKPAGSPLAAANASDNTATGAVNRDSSFKKAPSWPDILYRTQVQDEESEKTNYYYSDQKYKEWSDPVKDARGNAASLFEIARGVVGRWQPEAKSKGKSMVKDQWNDNTQHVKFGEEFTIRSQKRPLMLVYDPVSRSVMKHLIKYDPGQILTGNHLSIHWPWQILMQYHEEIQGLRDRLSDTEAADFEVSNSDGPIDRKEVVRRIDLLLKQINDVYSLEVMPELQNHRDSKVAEFKKLWLLFRPGEEVFTRVNGELSAFIVLAHRDHSPGDSKATQARINQLIIHVWNLQVVAGHLVRHMSQIAIDEYDGSRLIETLPVFPCKYAGSDDEARSLRETLVERGKRYFSIIKQPHAYMDYNGLTRDSEPRKYNGRVIIDPMSYAKYGARFSKFREDMDWDLLKLRPRREKTSIHFEPLKPNEIIQPEDNGGGQLWKNYNGIDPTSTSTQEAGFLEDCHFLLLPRNIRGFSLKDKQWETYDVDCLSEIMWCKQNLKDPFPGLILDEGKKKTLQANCRTAESRRTSPDLAADQIGGKGEGTVFLLEGPPGVGKTHTVECIANYTRQPLLSLSGCDIGATENSETKVQHWFDLAKAWDALILIDEADIFLTWRQPDNLKRNLLVTTFLRTIESFPGTIFLTTNRIGHLDLAINSRVDNAIHFASFDFESQKRLWKQYFEGINNNAEVEKGVFIEDSVMQAFLGEGEEAIGGLSGRDIRNGISMLCSWHDSQVHDLPVPWGFKLRLEHLQQAVENCKEKLQHILEANKVKNEAELAAIRRERQYVLVTSTQVDANDRQAHP
ncbi:MAG: hypothetical protein Q9170_005268 [Blastenia crenularia]